MPPKKQGFKKGASADNVDRVATNKSMRSRSTIQRLRMQRGGKEIRNKRGEIIGGTLMRDDRAGGKAVGTVSRVAPDRRWFGNTRVIGQDQLHKFREVCTEQIIGFGGF